MSAAVLDTHVAIWLLTDSGQLSPAASAAINSAEASALPLYLPTICLVEMTYLQERGRIPVDAMKRLRSAIDKPNASVVLALLTRDVADAVALIPRDDVPDMPDRIIAATAISLDVPLITRDGRIRASTVRTIW
jgi:PIN domain nuclease of toxin-antitoxin system